jgi:hypothetical protein
VKFATKVVVVMALAQELVTALAQQQILVLHNFVEMG